MIKRMKEIREIENPRQIHICVDLEMLKDLHVWKIQNKGFAGWYLVDDDKQIKGAAYAIGIKFCPFCGEWL